MLNKKVFISSSIVIGLTVMYALQNGGGNTQETQLVKPQSQKVSNYKEVFEEKEIVSRMEEIAELHELEKLNDDVSSLIEEADEIIAQNKLTLEPQTATSQNNTNNEKLTNELKALQLELEELSHEG